MITTRVGRIALSAMLVAGLAACKKDKKDDGQAKASGSGSASASASGTGTGTGMGSGTGTAAVAPKTEGGQAMDAIKGAIAKADGDAPKSGGGLGGMGAALGGLFGGGGAPKAAMAPQPDKKDKPPGDTPSEPVEDEGDDMGGGGGGDMPPEFANLKLPPPAPAGGDCAAVVQRIDGIVMAIYESQVGTLDEETKKMVQATMDTQMKEMEQQMLQMCESQKWPQNLKDCVLTSVDMAALQGCEQYVTEDMKNSSMGGGTDEPPEPPPPTEPAPAWSGGSDCAAVGDRIAQLGMNQAGAVPDDQKAMMEEAMKQATQQIAQMCTDGKWTDEQRGCFLKAGTIQDAEGCFNAVGGM